METKKIPTNDPRMGEIALMIKGADLSDVEKKGLFNHIFWGMNEHQYKNTKIFLQAVKYNPKSWKNRVKRYMRNVTKTIK